MTPLLQADFCAGYGKREILQGIQFDLEPGETLGLAGMSGSGKSTLAMAIMGLLPHTGGFAQGSVRLEGRNLLEMRPRELRGVLGARVALVPPSPHTALNPRLTLGGHFRAAWSAHSREDWKQGRAEAIRRLNAVDLPGDGEFLGRFPGQISTGQAQRVLIAMALLHRPALLIADEPTSALDTVTQAQLLKLLRRINETDGTAVLFISHDLLAAATLCTRLAVLSGGQIAEVVATAHLAEQAKHPATLALLDALPEWQPGLGAGRARGSSSEQTEMRTADPECLEGEQAGRG
ncbi:MAG: ATP-binding cassette domain-containing protein [Acidobacteriota bacterium]